MQRLQRPLERLARLWQHDIWQPRPSTSGVHIAWLHRFLRVVSTTLSGLSNVRVTSRAAALSFSTLLSLGPLVAIAVLVAGFALDEKDPRVIAQKIEGIIKYIAPQVSRLESLEKVEANPGAEVNTGVVQFINNSIHGAQSSAAGALSIITLVFIVLMLFGSVEDTFNDIWGVRRGRTWLVRIVFYWTILTLGAVIFFAAVGGLSAVTFINFFNEQLAGLPFGPRLVELARVVLPLSSAALMVGVLTLFYRYIPNTHVYWRSAMTGAVLVTGLIILNNLLAFSYFRRVDLTRSLYGSLSFIPILMLGLYVFWFFILVGGQVSYAVQNARFRNSLAVWSHLTESSRERLTLVVYLTVARRFEACLPPSSVSDLARAIRVPTQLLNESLNHLIDFGLVSPIPPPPEGGSSDYRYQPARPLDRVTLGEFKTLFDNHGDDPAGTALEHLDPLSRRYGEVKQEWLRNDFFNRSLQDLLREFDLKDEAVLALAESKAKRTD
ncbi:MAG: YihY/virulence factor BrkB family protein [Opitutaceae bacterium]|nr:YihY/virulence factor BrkB family protein [Opitutaceae bacterium]